MVRIDNRLSVKEGWSHFRIFDCMVQGEMGFFFLLGTVFGVGWAKVLLKSKYMIGNTQHQEMQRKNELSSWLRKLTW